MVRDLASGGADGSVRLWDPASGALRAKLDNATTPVQAMTFSPDGTRLVEGRRDGVVRTWDVASTRATGSLVPAKPSQPARPKSAPATAESSRGRAAAVTDGPGGPILVVTSSADPFSTYYAEILRAEGLNSFATADIGTVTAASLAAYDVVILAARPLTAAQVTTFSDWVTAGGNLIAMRPDSQLAGLLGLSSATGTLSDAYLLVDTTSAPGNGIVGETIQFHGTADRYTLSGARSVATLYSTRDRGDVEPGGHAAGRGNQRRAGRSLHLRPGPLGRLHPPGQPGVERARTRRHVPDSFRRPLLRQRSGGSAGGLGEPGQGVHSRRPTSSNGCWPTSSCR